MNWKNTLTDQERARLEAIPLERQALSAEYQRIRDRCKKRLRAKQELAQKGAVQNSAKHPQKAPISLG